MSTKKADYREAIDVLLQKLRDARSTSSSWRRGARIKHLDRTRVFVADEAAWKAKEIRRSEWCRQQARDFAAPCSSYIAAIRTLRDAQKAQGAK